MSGTQEPVTNPDEVRRIDMTEDFQYVSHARLEFHDGYRRAFLGEVPDPVTYGVQGTLRGALAGRKIAFDRDTYRATVDGRISGIGKTIRIKAIHVHYDVTIPADA